MSATESAELLEVNGREVRISHPDKVVFPEPGLTKLDLVRYYVSVAEGALRGAAGRPMVLKRFVKGIDHEAFFQKRAPDKRPDWIDTATLHYARGTSAEEVVVRDAAALAWVVNLGCIDLNPHPVRAEDLDHPDELRVDLDPMPGVEWGQLVDVAFVARDVLAERGLVAWPKTSGSRGIHLLVRLEPRWDFREVRLAAETLAREVALRVPHLATARWWKEERGERVFVDFNQNAKDRTVASAYSVRPRPDARVSTPLDWEELLERRPEEFTVRTVLERFAERGDPIAGLDVSAGVLDGLLDLAAELGPVEKDADAEPLPVIEIARAETKGEALDALERWKTANPRAVEHLHPADVLVDGMRGSSSLWYRIRVNLQHVPEAQRPEQEPLLVDYDPWKGRFPGGEGAAGEAAGSGSRPGEAG
ncbi:non-homologous end-joining DNA ligase [Agromyces sp. LHK192]|uniref:non-homologous end-joining DNA ligase n=1 Tax=Agromyces sp. LHK192 TaxID=2498704 RepID=UPI000FDB1EC2|nr:non-homologous end-joining DNA ligase [Agromyces sp. LHK192]